MKNYYVFERVIWCHFCDDFEDDFDDFGVILVSFCVIFVPFLSIFLSFLPSFSTFSSFSSFLPPFLTPPQPSALQAAVRHASSRSFNSISVDGDSSTNDSVAVLANGLAGGAALTESSPSFPTFVASLNTVMSDLAKYLVRDGEGATKFVTIRVQGARTYADAKQVANSVARSALFKTAMFGQDANWGRVLCAVGYSGVAVDPTKVSLWFGEGEGGERELELVRNGTPFDTNEERASAILKNKDISVRISLGEGEEMATMWTCDFSYDYVKINADYRS